MSSIEEIANLLLTSYNISLTIIVGLDLPLNNIRTYIVDNIGLLPLP